MEMRDPVFQSIKKFIIDTWEAEATKSFEAKSFTVLDKPFQSGLIQHMTYISCIQDTESDIVKKIQTLVKQLEGSQVSPSLKPDIPYIMFCEMLKFQCRLVVTYDIAWDSVKFRLDIVTVGAIA